MSIQYGEIRVPKVNLRPTAPCPSSMRPIAVFQLQLPILRLSSRRARWDASSAMPQNAHGESWERFRRGPGSILNNANRY